MKSNCFANDGRNELHADDVDVDGFLKVYEGVGMWGLGSDSI